MTFLNPILLYAGLACIAVPIIVHLLTRRRRKPIEWAAMRFLIEAYKKHKRRLTLEQLLLLAARCLLVALIALAIGKPVLGAAGLLGGRGPRTLYLLLDNSLPASALGSDGSAALSRHKERAAKLLAQLDQSRGDRAALITLGAPADALVMPPSNDLAAVARLVESVEATDSRGDLPGAIARLKSETGEPGNKPGGAGRSTIVVVSDFLAGSADTDRALPAFAAEVSKNEPVSVLATSPLGAGLDNIAIVKAEPLRSVLLARPTDASVTDAATADAPTGDATNQVRVSLARYGPGVGQPGVTQVSVYATTGATTGATNGPIARAPVRWTPGQAEASVVVPIELPSVNDAGSMVIVAQIDRDAVAGDNMYRRPTETRRAIQVGVLTPPGQVAGTTVQTFRPVDWLRIALQPERLDARQSARGAGLRVLDVDPRALRQPGALAGLDGVIVPSPDLLDAAAWGRLGDFCRGGGLVIVFPAAEATVHLWPDAMMGAFGLEWTIAREATPVASAELAEPLTETTESGDLLAVLAGELPELTKPVRVTKLLAINLPSSSGETLLRAKDRSPLVVIAVPGRARSSATAEDKSDTSPANRAAQVAPVADESHPQRGLVVVFGVASDLRWTDMPTKPLMVPLMQELVRQGVGRSVGVWSGPAGTMPFVPEGTRELRSVAQAASLPNPGTRGSERRDEVISLGAGGAAGGIVAGAIRNAGVWRAQDVRGVSLGLLAVNADPFASHTEARSLAQVTRWLGGIAGEERVTIEAAPNSVEGAPAEPRTLLGDDPRPPVSAPLLLAALAVALAELVLARVFSHAGVTRSADAVQAPLPVERAA